MSQARLPKDKCYSLLRSVVKIDDRQGYWLVERVSHDGYWLRKVFGVFSQNGNLRKQDTWTIEGGLLLIPHAYNGIFEIYVGVVREMKIPPTGPIRCGTFKQYPVKKSKTK
jgi:hypothetical protein